MNPPDFGAGNGATNLVIRSLCGVDAEWAGAKKAEAEGCAVVAIFRVWSEAAAVVAI